MTPSSSSPGLPQHAIARRTLPGADPAAWTDDRVTRPAPLWLRMLVLLGLGVVLLFPLGWLMRVGYWRDWKERTAVREVAEQFLSAASEHMDYTRPFLTHDAGSAFPLEGTSHLQIPFLQYAVEAITIDGKEAQVLYRSGERAVDGDLDLATSPELAKALTTSGIRPTPEWIQETSREMQQGLEQMGKGLKELTEAEQQALSKRLSEKMSGVLLKVAREQLVGREGVLYLRREKDRWRVMGIARFPVAEGKEPKAFLWVPRKQGARPLPEIAFPTSRLQGLAAFEELESLEAARWESSWKLNLERENTPADEILREVVEGEGRKFSANRARFPELERPVSLKLRGTSRIEAIEKVCQQVGLHPEYSAYTTTFTLKRGPRAWSAAIAGPFLVEIKGVSEFPAEATGVLKLQVTGIGLPSTVCHLLVSGNGNVTIDRVAGAGGEDLYHAENQSYYPITRPSSSTLQAGDYTETVSVPLRNLLRKVDNLAVVAGRLRVPLPERVDVFPFESLAKGATQEGGAIRLTLQVVPSLGSGKGRILGARSVFEFETEGLEGRGVEVAAYDSSGKGLFCGTPSPDAEGRLELLLPGQPSRVVFKVISVRHIEIPFNFQKIPLPGRAPYQLEPARFPDHASPVTVEVRGPILPPLGIQLVPRIHVQKAVEKIHMELRCLAKDGRVLKTIPYTAASFDGGKGRLRVWVDGVRLLGVPPPMPEGTKKVEVKVTGVGFADGSKWSP